MRRPPFGCSLFFCSADVREFHGKDFSGQDGLGLRLTDLPNLSGSGSRCRSAGRKTKTCPAIWAKMPRKPLSRQQSSFSSKTRRAVITQPAMENGRRNTEVLASAERYRTLLDINNAIITNLTQESLLHAICEALQKVLPVYRAALTLYDPDRDTIRIHALSTHWNSDYFRVGVLMN